MKFLVLILLFVSSLAFGATTKYETICKNQDCFKYGWVTQAKNYVLNTTCTNQDCTRYGWSSVANDQSTYTVACRMGGCFKDGWTSAQTINKKIYYDDVLCKSASCLKHGWNVRAGYDLMGGNVVCNNGDCSKYGGKSFWRGRPSQTTCYASNCYKYGWTLYVY